MPPPPGLTKADVSNFIELYGNEEGGQARFAVYLGKPGPKAWCPVKDLAEARRKAGDMNSVQSVAIREGQPLVPTISFEAWRAEQQASGSAEPGKANGKGKGKGKAKGGRAAGPKPTVDDDVDALVASIEAAASVDGPADAQGDANAEADANADADAPQPADADTAAAPERDEREAAGRRVRIDGLAARPELNGRCGVARRFDVAKGRYEVVVEGEAEPLLLKPANLLTLHAAVSEEVATGSAAESAAESAAQVAAAEEAREAAAGSRGELRGEAAREAAARAAVAAKVAAARAAQALDEAMAGSGAGAAGMADMAGSDARKLHLEDILSAGEVAGIEKSFEKNDKYDHTVVKDFRMQGEFGAKKFIKP